VKKADVKKEAVSAYVLYVSASKHAETLKTQALIAPLFDSPQRV
jgi:hypothetical protein